jgi:hypothetical protein
VLSLAVVAAYVPTVNRAVLLDGNLTRDSRRTAAVWLSEHAKDAAVFLPPEAFFAADRLAAVRAKPVNGDLGNLHALASSEGRAPCYVVALDYAAPRANDRVRAMLRTARAEQVFDVPGAAVTVRFQPTPSPGLKVYRLACGQPS